MIVEWADNMFFWEMEGEREKKQRANIYWALTKRPQLYKIYFLLLKYLKGSQYYFTHEETGLVFAFS